MSKERFIVWSNLDLNLEDWRADLEEEYPDASEDDLVRKMCEINDSYLIAESGDYNYDADLDNYYNYEAFGEDYLGEQAGRFTEHGYVGINDWETVQHYLSSDAMEMGGM